MSDVLDQSGKAVLVTGGTRGVGRGIAEGFLAQGADVVICGRTEPDALPSAGGREAAFVAADVRDVDAVDALVTRTVELLGRLDVLVNNAGGTPPAFVADASPRFSASVISLNLIAPLFVARRANEVMQGQPHGGVVINLGTVNGLRAAPGNAPYGAAKAGLLNLTESLAVEWAPKVRVNAVTPGIVATEELIEQYYGNDDALVARVAADIPLGRFATPEDVAGICLFLASPLAAHVSGSNLLVHGGGEPVSSLPGRSDPSG